MDANQSPDLSLSTPAPAQPGDATGPQVPAAPAPVMPPLNPLPPADSTASIPVATVNDDNDDSSIDQEWVDKAKAIVEQTKGDPFAQNRELNKAKADYLKTRYNKDFKVAEDKVQ
jgi:hypothetical protein